MLYVPVHPSWHLNFLGNSTRHEMSASIMRYACRWVLAYAVTAKCYVGAEDEQNLFPYKEIFTMIETHLFFPKRA